ncbi:nucleotidyl transferase AbiEii/AbiGii toxin family protein [Solirubrobacter soli]|uniref:nucleotidyl transferase AbiEii/AbiGii toxin family protein n=1 Tax=Solirubrobacter soli TaxID=363832 RepID=UPI00041EFFDF|nr:nucleotidyl transferase AbiEii/AbiGii toxin family protein [Solirubrobacter soli]
MPADRGKPPHNVHVLQRWVGEHADATGVAPQRVRRWISFMTVAAVLDRIRDEDDPVFALKGGVSMELRFGLDARATTDYDAAYREPGGDMVARLDEALTEPYGDFTLSRTEIKPIGNTGAIQLDLKLSYRGRRWATVILEVAPTEGDSGQELDHVPGIPLGAFGLPGPEEVACVAVRYQIAQKLHACTQIFATGRQNDRVRDLVDVLMLQGRIDDMASVRDACVEIFSLRAKHAWPPTVTIFEDWPDRYAGLAADLDFEPSNVNDAAAAVQALIDAIDAADGST